MNRPDKDLTMEEITIHKFELQSTRSDCFVVVSELDELFKVLESGEIPEDLERFKRYTVNRLRRRHSRLLELEEGL